MLTADELLAASDLNYALGIPSRGERVRLSGDHGSCFGVSDIGELRPMGGIFKVRSAFTQVPSKKLGRGRSKKTCHIKAWYS